MPITHFDHITIRAHDIDASARFYQDVMGFRIKTLNDFAFPFRLLFLGDQALAHLLGAGPELDEFLARNAPSYAAGIERGTGNLEHIALNATGLADFVARLQDAHVSFVQRTLANHGVVQLLFSDLDGIEIELNFPVSELAS